MDISATEKVIKRICELRNRKWFIGGIRSSAVQSLEAAVGEFGLSSDLSVYEEIRPGRAIVVLTRLLHQTLAYGTELMPVADAATLANEFISLFDAAIARYYTNVDDEFYVGSTGYCSSPATGATFDAGILIITGDFIVCVWFTDED